MPERKITYLKLQEKIKLEDGTTYEKGTSVRLNYKEGPFFNVEVHDSHNIKRIFWITEEKGKTSATRTEKWTKKLAEEHHKDLAETWFELNTTSNDGESKKTKVSSARNKKK